jgi:hypothetical protein
MSIIYCFLYSDDNLFLSIKSEASTAEIARQVAAISAKLAKWLSMMTYA